MNFLLGHAHQRREPRAAFIHHLAKTIGRLPRPVGLDLAAAIGFFQTFDHLNAGIGPTSVFKECLPLQVGIRKGRELRTHPVEIEISHFCTSSRET